MVRDDLGDDAAKRRAHDFHLHGNCGHCRAQERTDRLAIRTRRRLRSVWFGFSVFAALGQIGLTRAALLDQGMASASPLLSGVIFIFAGIYQFSALKHACLTQCRHPFPVFFTNWATTPAGGIQTRI